MMFNPTIRQRGHATGTSGSARQPASDFTALAASSGLSGAASAMVSVPFEGDERMAADAKLFKKLDAAEVRKIDDERRTGDDTA